MGNTTGNITPTAEPTHGQILIGNTGNFPSLGTITAGAGIGVVNAGGSITISSSAGGLAYSEETGANVAMAINTSYGANRGGGVTFTLPANSVAGSVMEIDGIAGLWILAQNAGQQVKIGNKASTVGVGGTLTATDAGDCITLRCIDATNNANVWRVTSVLGNITVV